MVREEKGPHWGSGGGAELTGPDGLQSPSTSFLNCRIESFWGIRPPLRVLMGTWYRQQLAKQKAGPGPVCLAGLSGVPGPASGEQEGVGPERPSAFRYRPPGYDPVILGLEVALKVGTEALVPRESGTSTRPQALGMG